VIAGEKNAMTVRFEETLLLLLLGGEAWMTLGRWRYRPFGRRTNGQLAPGGKLDVVTAKSGLFFQIFSDCVPEELVKS